MSRAAERLQDDDIDLMALLGTLLHGKWIIFATTILFIGIGIAYAFLATPIYQSNAIVQVEDKKGGIPGLEDMQSVLGEGKSSSTTEIELIKSRAIVGQAIDQLQLDIVVEPNYFPIIGKAYTRYIKPLADGLNNPLFGLGKFAWGGEIISISRFEVPSTWQGEEFYLQYLGKQRFILKDPNDIPIFEGRVGESLVQGEYKLLVSNIVARPQTLFSLIKRNRLSTIIDYQQALTVSERGKDSGILSLSYESESPQAANDLLNSISSHYVRQNVERTSAEAAKSLDFLKQHLPDVKIQLESAEEKLNEYQMSANSVDISVETESVLKQIVALDTRVSELELKRTELERLYTPEHPTYRALLEQLNKLRQEKKQFEQKVSDLPATQQELLRLTRDVQVSTEIYTQLLNKAQELDIARAGTVGNVRVIDDAVVDVSTPVNPKKKLIIAIALLVGCGVGIAFVLARAFFNRGVKSPQELEELGVSVYASIPLSPDQDKIEQRYKSKRSLNTERSLLLAASNPADLAVEALRGLRTSLHFAMMDAENNIIMIAGPSPKVGKSFVSTNLAALCAEGGLKVLIIDADMRKGYMQRIFRTTWDNGLSEVIAGSIDFEASIKKTEVDNLDFISRGQIPPNPSELLMHNRFSELLDWANERYDLVIVDTPPILAVTDSAIVGRLAGTTLVVSRFALNPAREVEVTLSRLEQNGVNVKGMVLNAVERNGSRYYGYDNYGYYQYEYKSNS